MATGNGQGGFPPLPTCQGQADDETRGEYGARVLRFLLAEACTATLSGEQLELADMAAQRAATELGTGTCTTEGPEYRACAKVQQRLTDLRHVIAAILRTRARQTSQDAPGAAIAPQGGQSPGRPALLQPRPTQRPPGGAYAEVGRAEIRF